MRIASFKAGDAELIVTQFAKDNFGGMLANINRWRGQAGLDEITDETTVTPQPVKVSNQSGALYDFAGRDQPRSCCDDPGRRTGVVFQARRPGAGVAQQLPAFDEFLKSVSFGK